MTLTIIARLSKYQNMSRPTKRYIHRQVTAKKGVT